MFNLTYLIIFFQTFKPLVDTPGLYKTPKGSKLPVEFLSDLKLDFQDCNKLKVITVSFIVDNFQFTSAYIFWSLKV